MIFIDWGDVFVSKRLADGDVVTASDEGPSNNGTTEFGIELAQHKTWWKGLQVLDNTDGQMAFLEVQDGKKGPVWFVADNRDIEVGGKVCLWKAKMFGVHTPMYVLAGLEEVRVKGRRILLRWSAD